MGDWVDQVVSVIGTGTIDSHIGRGKYVWTPMMSLRLGLRVSFSLDHMRVAGGQGSVFIVVVDSRGPNNCMEHTFGGHGGDNWGVQASGVGCGVDQEVGTIGTSTVDSGIRSGEDMWPPMVSLRLGLGISLSLDHVR